MTEFQPTTDNYASDPIVPSAINEQKASQPLYQKSARDFQSKDLEGLKSLEEGWFVEFKEQLPDTAKLARSISSFANSHGGLLIIGAKEEQKTRRLHEFKPMSRSNADNSIVRAREAVTAHVTPPPYFEAKAVEINSLDINVDERWIVVITVPKGNLGPYLHSNGCIYVRVGDAAAPHALADLTQQERLWSDSLGRKSRLKSRIEQISKQFQHGTPSVHLVILADEPQSYTKSINIEDFRQLALANRAQHSDSTFDHVQTLDTSLVARRTEKNVDSSSILWDFDRSRRLHFIQIPIATHIWNGEEFDNRGDLFKLDELGKKLIARSVSKSLMILNLLPTLYFLSVIFWKVKALHQREGYKGQLKFNASAVDCKGTIPFLGTPAYFSEVEKTNFPYVMREIGFFEPLDEISNWPKIELQNYNASEGLLNQQDAPTAFGAFSRIAQSLGIPSSMSIGITENSNSKEEIELNVKPLIELFASLQTSSFSFISQQNPNTIRTG